MDEINWVCLPAGASELIKKVHLPYFYFCYPEAKTLEEKKQPTISNNKMLLFIGILFPLSQFSVILFSDVCRCLQILWRSTSWKNFWQLGIGSSAHSNVITAVRL